MNTLRPGNVCKIPCSNDYFIVTSAKRDEIQGYIYNCPAPLIFSHNPKNVEKVVYDTLLVSHRNFNKIKNFLSMCMRGFFYVSYNNKRVLEILSHLSEYNLLKVYTSKEQSEFLLIYVDEIKRTIRYDGPNKGLWYKLIFHNV